MVGRRGSEAIRVFFSFLWEEGIDEEDGKQKIIRSEQHLQRENLNILDLIFTIFYSNPTVQSENAVLYVCQFM